MKSSIAVHAAALASLLSAPPLLANDRWERGSNPTLSDDDAFDTTRNELRPGDVQSGHDLEGTPGAPDRDFYLMRTQLHHTYEALVRSQTLFFGAGTAFCVPPGGTSVCPRLDLVAADGTVTFGAVPDGASNNVNVASALRLLVFGTSTTQFLRVQGDTGGSAHTSDDLYDIVLRDTTYAIPRFNNSGTQVTVLSIQNNTDGPVNVEPQFFDENGATLAVLARILPARGVWIVPTSATAALAGKSGSVLVRHSGAYGALSGKAVSLEPATGFTFDTPMTAIPQ